MDGDRRGAQVVCQVCYNEELSQPLGFSCYCYTEYQINRNHNTFCMYTSKHVCAKNF